MSAATTHRRAPKVGAMAQTPHVLHFYPGPAGVCLSGQPHPLPTGTPVTVAEVNPRAARALIQATGEPLFAWVGFEALEVSR